jgi:SAM-dependent methyltransferase
MAHASNEDPDPHFDLNGVFCDDYLYFYGPYLTPEQNERQADVICRLLKLDGNDRILDLGCGHGRISNELATRGMRVTGIDSSEFFLDVAREAAASAKLAVEYVQGDMRSLPWREEFDAIFCWYTTYGYFSDSDNRTVLHQGYNALKPGGRLLVEQSHRNALLRRGMPQTDVTRRGDDIMIDQIDYDVFNERTLTERIMVRNGTVRTATFSIRLYSYAELCSRLASAGFKSVEGFGRGGEPLTTFNPRLLVVAHK